MALLLWMVQEMPGQVLHAVDDSWIVTFRWRLDERVGQGFGCLFFFFFCFTLSSTRRVRITQPTWYRNTQILGKREQSTLHILVKRLHMLSKEHTTSLSTYIVRVGIIHYMAILPK